MNTSQSDTGPAAGRTDQAPAGEASVDAPRPQPPLRRATTDKMLGGVCAGIGRRFRIDPAILRVLFVVGILAAGVGLLLYLALWLLIPADTDWSPAPLTRSLWRLVLGVLLGVGAVAAALGWLSSLGGLVGVIVGGLVVGLAIWLYTRPRPPAWSPGSAGSPGMPGAGTAAAARLGASVPLGQAVPTGQTEATGFAYGGTGVAVGSATQPLQPNQPGPRFGDAGGFSPPVGGWGSPEGVSPPPRKREPMSYLGLVTILVAVVIGALVATLMALGWVQLSLVAYLSILLVVLAGGLIVGAFAGRARWLIAPAAVLALLIGMVALVPQSTSTYLSDGVGERLWEPTTSGVEYRLGTGSATLDLRTWAARPGIVQPAPADAVSATVGLGELKVLVPESWQVTVSERVGIGSLVVNGVETENVMSDFANTQVLAPVGEPTGQLMLDVNVDVGELSLRQVPSALESAAGAVDSPDPTVPDERGVPGVPVVPGEPSAVIRPQSSGPVAEDTDKLAGQATQDDKKNSKQKAKNR